MTGMTPDFEGRKESRSITAFSTARPVKCLRLRRGMFLRLCAAMRRPGQLLNCSAVSRQSVGERNRHRRAQDEVTSCERRTGSC